MITRQAFLVALCVAPCVALAGLLPAAEPARGQTSLAAGKDFSKIDAYALAAPASATRSVRHLAQYLIAGTETDLERVRAIYVWITTNVKYDYVALRSGQIRSTNLTADDVLRTRLTVCDGYSRLFEALAEMSGVVVARVEGYVEGLSRYGRGVMQNGGDANHAWNAVRINRGWHLIDTTWGAGSAFEAYFMPAPGKLIRTHFPSDPKWQLLNPYLTVREYQAQVLKQKTFVRQ